ncbi:MAG TPA: glycogen-binding domain-containing protein, partial [Lentimicrobium sp.]|nr:glycogen-binding domain-containing protein [Lentimicrobium sp.]
SVGEGIFENSVLTFRPNYTFTLAMFTDAKKVIVTGSFNGWREDACAMTLKDGVWTCPVFLSPGKHTYKFIVDGQWMVDPANEVWEANAQGTGNSVLWVEP